MVRLSEEEIKNYKLDWIKRFYDVKSEKDIAVIFYDYLLDDGAFRVSMLTDEEIKELKT